MSSETENKMDYRGERQDRATIPPDPDRNLALELVRAT
jgi:hypothetical protein